MLGFVRVIRCLSIALRSHPRPAQPTLAFGINVSDYSFADAVALSGFGENFDDFLAGLAAGEYYVNIHTDTFNAGEIRGPDRQRVCLCCPTAGICTVAVGRSWWSCRVAAQDQKLIGT